MNRIISLLVLLLTFSCEHDKPKQDNSDAKGIDLETTRNKEQHGFLPLSACAGRPLSR